MIKLKKYFSFVIALCMVISIFTFMPVVGASVYESNSIYTASAKAKAKMILGTPCIQQDGLWFPKTLGKGKLSKKQLRKLGKSKDLKYMQVQISTLSDALRFFRANNFHWGSSDSYEKALLKKKASPIGVCYAVTYLLHDDMDETGVISYYCRNGSWGSLGYIKKDDIYYAFDGNAADSYYSRWMGAVKKGKYTAISLDALIKQIKESYNVNGKIDTIDVKEYPDNFDIPQYSKAEIQELAKADLTLDEAADKLSTISDVMNYLIACDYEVGKFFYNPCLWYDNINWWNVLSADFTYRHLAGTCGGTSNLFNRLLQDDFDEEGFVNITGHVFNYFKRNGIYYFCDFAGCAFTNDTTQYLVYKTTDPVTFGDYYPTIDPDFNNKDSERYLTYMFMYSSNGGGMLPASIRHYSDKAESSIVIYSDKAENLIILFERGLKLVPGTLPPKDAWPPETHIPDDDGNYYD